MSIDAHFIFCLFRSLAYILRVHFDVLFLLVLFCYKALQIVRQKFETQIAHSIVVKRWQHSSAKILLDVYTSCVFLSLSFTNDVIIKISIMCLFYNLGHLHEDQILKIARLPTCPCN